MSGLADMLTRLFTLMAGDGTGRQIVDMTDIKGNYQAAMDFSLADLMSMARSAGMDGPSGAPDGGNPGRRPAAVTSGPGGTSVVKAVQALGLELESRKAMVDRLIVLRVEKDPDRGLAVLSRGDEHERQRDCPAKSNASSFF